MSVKKGQQQKLVNKINAEVIRSVQPGRAVFESSLSGFGVRCYPKGNKAFVVVTSVADPTKKHGRAVKWKTLGPAAGKKAIPLPDARTTATALLAENRAVGSTTHALTLRNAIALYCGNEKERRPKTRKDVKGALELHCKDPNGTSWLDRRLLDITGTEVYDLYVRLLPHPDEFVRAHELRQRPPSPARANFVIGSFRSVWRSALRGVKFPAGRPDCPTDHFKKKPNLPRTQTLDDAALAALATKLRAFKGTGAYCAYLLLIALNGLRAGEPSKLLWIWVDEDRFTLAAHDKKEGRMLEVPMTPANRVILDYMRQLRGKLGPEKYVFASNNTKPVPAEMRCYSFIGKKLMPRPYTLHALRRTFKRHARMLDVPEYMVEALMAHTAIKDKHDMSAAYDPLSLEDRHDLLAKVQDRLLAKLGGLDGLLPSLPREGTQATLRVSPVNDGDRAGGAPS